MTSPNMEVTPPRSMELQSDTVSTVSSGEHTAESPEPASERLAKVVRQEMINRRMSRCLLTHQLDLPKDWLGSFLDGHLEDGDDDCFREALVTWLADQDYSPRKQNQDMSK